jgi:hypothetical protein
MGFDPARLGIVRRAYQAHPLPLTSGSEHDIELLGNDARWARPLGEWRPGDSLSFRPHFGWVNAIEWRADR